MLRGARAAIDLGALSRNLRELRRISGKPVTAVVKADAYGHGAVEASRAFLASGADMLAVAFVSEARALRESGIKAPLLVLFDRTEIAAFFDLNLTPVINDYKTGSAFSDEALKRNAALPVHLNFDTGMGRMGFNDIEEMKKTASLPGLKIAGLMSHFSDADMADAEFASEQIRLFGIARAALKSMGHKPICHVANSAASLSINEAGLDCLRPGIILYGHSPFSDGRAMAGDFRPGARIWSNILALRKIPKGRPVSYGRTFIAKRDTLAAVLAVGYADGFNRLFSNNADVLIKGKRAPVIGRVCMDLCVADATEINGVSENDTAVIMGKDGNEEITSWEIARRASTIPYEILTSLLGLCVKTYEGAPA